MGAAESLQEQGVNVRVVSMPNPGRFLAQEESWRESVLPSDLQARVAVEAGVSAYWYRFIGDRGRIIGVDRFGASAPGTQVLEHYGMTVENVMATVLAVIESE